MAFRISDQAQADTVDIFLDGCVRWGEQNAERYYNSIYDTFEEISEFPFACRERNEMVFGLRIRVHESHLILYRIDEGVADILRVVHGHFDWQNEEF